MRAITVVPGVPGSATLSHRPDPPADSDLLLVETLALGVCGTDHEIVSGHYGTPPPGRTDLVLGHEVVGRVVHAPKDAGFKRDELVAGIVRRPDPVPCPYCAVGEWDMCRNGLYTERGIKEQDGYGADLFLLEPAFAIRVDPLLGELGVLIEPASVVAKAWDHAERIGGRSAAWRPRSVLVTGAGPIGLLSAMMGRQRDLEVHVFDRVEQGVKPQLVRDLGGRYHGGTLPPLDTLAPDIIIECTGSSAVIAEVVSRSAPSGIVCLAGVSSGGHRIAIDLGELNRTMVLENDVVFGSVNANRSHYRAAAASLAKADRTWLSRLISRKVPVRDWQQAFERKPDDVKVVVEFGGSR